ncbi:unnamed protein product [Allacma fusca]|uniref:Uncharacterized protein n=1 Tax=Allacma fusca TaxID=39272 RepID=A0A8J2KNG1_9HEXA|nr:unnamed protein product [Allacma fusca]
MKTVKGQMRTDGFEKFGIVLFLAMVWACAHGAFHNFCTGQAHFSGFEFGCCKGAILDSGIDFQANWKKCSTPSGNETETIPETMWRVYSCIIKAALKGKQLTLTSYANAMSANYPKGIKTMISETVGTTVLNTEVMSPQQKLNAIRVTYHNIERKVCSGNNGTMTLEKLTSCKSPEDIYRENIHNRGDCCAGVQIPIRLTYLRREPSESSQECTLDFMKKGGELSKYAFQGGKYVKTSSLQTYEKKTFYNTSDAQQMCLQTCIAIVDLEQETKISPLPFNFTNFASAVTQIFSKNVRDSILQKFPPNLHDEVDDFVYTTLPRIIESEFNHQSNHTYLKMILKTCESHNLAVRKIEEAIFDVCRK